MVMGFPGETEESHPEIFNLPPRQSQILKEGQLPYHDVQTFYEQGFLIIDSFFKPEELEPVKSSINDLVDKLAQNLHKAGRVKDLYTNYGFTDRLSKLEEDFPGASILLHKIGTLPESFGTLWSNERVLNLVEQLLGTSDIDGHPVWNLRTKVPNVNAAVVPWHQDSAYLDNDSYKVFLLTAWIPLIDANYQNGCMQVIRFGHKTGKVARHTGCWKDTWYLMLDEEEIKKTLGCNLEKDVITCEVPFGGLLIFSNLLPHRSITNVSPNIRWSLDFRWQNGKKPNGFYGLKDGIKMRSFENGNFQIDWEVFNSVNRHKKQDEDCHKNTRDEFDIAIPGPWMKKWEMVNKNRHTMALEEEGNLITWDPSDLLVG